MAVFSSPAALRGRENTFTDIHHRVITPAVNLHHPININVHALNLVPPSRKPRLGPYRDHVSYLHFVNKLAIPCFFTPAAFSQRLGSLLVLGVNIVRVLPYNVVLPDPQRRQLVALNLEALDGEERVVKIPVVAATGDYFGVDNAKVSNIKGW